MRGVCLVGTSSPFADAISNSPLFVVLSFVSFSHSIVNFLASLIKASYYLVFVYTRLVKSNPSNHENEAL
jgi:hypothetical protein